MARSANRRLLHDLGVVGALVEHDRPTADERLAARLGADHLQALRSQLAAQAQSAGRRRLLLERAVARFSRLKQWQWSMFIVALGCGVAVSTMGVIQLIWQLRSVLSGLGAVAVVLVVFVKTRHHQRLETWIGS